MPSVICKNLAKSGSSTTVLVLIVTSPPVAIVVKLYIISLLVLLVISSISSMLYLPWNLIEPTPSFTNLGSDNSPFCIVSAVLNTNVLILALGPAVTPLVNALTKVCIVVSEDIPTLRVIVVAVIDLILIGA